jgi:hypothetical protein
VYNDDNSSCSDSQSESESITEPCDGASANAVTVIQVVLKNILITEGICNYAIISGFKRCIPFTDVIRETRETKFVRKKTILYLEQLEKIEFVLFYLRRRQELQA